MKPVQFTVLIQFHRNQAITSYHPFFFNENDAERLQDPLRIPGVFFRVLEIINFLKSSQIPEVMSPFKTKKTKK